MRPSVVPEIDGTRDSEGGQVDDRNAVARPLTCSIVTHDRPFAVVRRRYLVRCFTGGQRREDTPRGCIDDRGGIVAHVAGDKGTVRRVRRGKQERRRGGELKCR